MSDKTVYVVDDDSIIRRFTTILLTSLDFAPRPFGSGADFLENFADLSPGCILLDLCMPDIDGMQILERLGHQQLSRFPTIMVTGHADVATAVRAMRLGALDIVQKPYSENVLLSALERGFAYLTQNSGPSEERALAQQLVSKLSRRETEVLSGLISGMPNKVVAHNLNISVRTVEMHRGKVMERMGVRTFSEAMRFAFLSGLGGKALN
jgi:two-component system, LuxR family, response regulator FixJ